MLFHGFINFYLHVVKNNQHLFKMVFMFHSQFTKLSYAQKRNHAILYKINSIRTIKTRFFKVCDMFEHKLIEV